MERRTVKSNRISWRLRALASLTVVAVAMLGTAGAVLAAAPVKGATYKGKFKAGFDMPKISFKVSADGKRVTHLHTSDVGLYCVGGGGVVPTNFKDATISANGTFKSTAKDIIKIGPRKGQVGENLKITGTFKSGGKESGTMTTTYAGGISTTCSGSSKYSTKAS